MDIHLKNHKNICDISALIQKRKPAYEAAADYSVTTDNRSARQIADEILEILEKEGMLS